MCFCRIWLSKCFTKRMPKIREINTSDIVCDRRKEKNISDIKSDAHLYYQNKIVNVVSYFRIYIKISRYSN